MADDPAIATVELPIVEVTVQEDRALVRREGAITLPPGRSRVRVEGVAPVLVDKSLTATVRGDEAEGPAAEVLGVKATRWRVTEDRQRPQALAELLVRRRALEAEQRAQERRRIFVDGEHHMAKQMHAATLDELAEDTAWDQADLARAQATLDTWAQRTAALADEVCEILADRSRTDRELADVHQLAAVAQRVEAHATAALELELRQPGPEPRAVQVRVDYLVPGALWRPWHRAHLQRGEAGDVVRLECEGCVWQATGEDWSDARIVLSTERPSLGLSPPELHTDRLALRKRGPAVQVQAREQQIHHAGLGGEAEGGSREAEQLPGIDDGGEAQRLVARAPATVAGDGRPHRVPLFELSAPAEVGLLCLPELAPVVLLRSEQTNGGSQPLLAGPVDLVRDSGLVGRTSILYVAPGERFELGWGPDPALRVTRELELLDEERKALRSWTRKPRRVEIKLSNLEPTPRQIKVRERIAVSEIDEVKVELQQARPQATPDADGIVEWDVRLRGFDHEHLVLEWALVVHDDVRGI
ncbi:MAG: mucoidy inhibitor MuiA family protein [Myxococcales bacterium]|nr:mucoidy inhibitor MuiA family protein [Myxococcales bacterium]